jgi:hypothetical protein
LADLTTAVTINQAITFQLEREVASVLDFTGEEMTVSTDFVEAEFRERLERAGRIPGAHASGCGALSGRIEEALEHINMLPPALVPSKTLRPLDFYASHTSSLCYLGGHTWLIGRMGDSLGGGNEYKNSLNAIIENHELDGVINVHVVMLNADLHRLYRDLEVFRLPALVASVKAVNTRLKRLQED